MLDLVKERPHSPEWLAARVLRFAERTRYHMESGNAKDAVWNAIHLAQAIRLTDFKLDLEGPLRIGVKVRTGARESGCCCKGTRVPERRSSSGKTGTEAPSTSRRSPPPRPR